jgi:hypothetical protein
MMVGNKIRALRARLMLLVVDDDGMSTVEYAIAISAGLDAVAEQLGAAGFGRTNSTPPQIGTRADGQSMAARVSARDVCLFHCPSDAAANGSGDAGAVATNFRHP